MLTERVGSVACDENMADTTFSGREVKGHEAGCGEVSEVVWVVCHVISSYASTL